MERSAEIVAKILIIANQSVGKTSILERYTEGRWSETTTATLGMDFVTKTVKLDNGI